MIDSDIFERVNSLSSEEAELYQKAGDGGGLSVNDRRRLETIRVELDRCYDLLHQRQGLRDAGKDPSEAELRPEGTVEGYEQ